MLRIGELSRPRPERPCAPGPGESLRPAAAGALTRRPPAVLRGGRPPARGREDVRGMPRSVGKVADAMLDTAAFSVAADNHRTHPGSNAILEGRMLSWDDVKAHALDRQATSVGSTSRRDEVHRSVHARTSLQNQRTSVHAPPPSGTIWFLCRSIPHSQQETTAARRAAIPSAAGVLIVSAMPSSPPGYWSAIPIAWPKSPGPAAGSTTAGWMLGDNRHPGGRNGGASARRATPRAPCHTRCHRTRHGCLGARTSHASTRGRRRRSLAFPGGGIIV
jgi:hypothetical protein